VADDRRLWEERKQEWRDREWNLASSLAEKAALMLRFPVARTVRVDAVDEEGRPVAQTVVEPADWKPSDATSYASTASKLARLSAGEPTEHKRITVDNILDALPAEFRDAVRAILAGQVSGD